MMVRLFMFASLCFAFSGYAQKSLEFDNVAEYKVMADPHKSISTKKYQFFNSNDNSYLLSVYENGKNVDMWLTLKSGQSYYGQISREDFFVEAISLKCPKNWFKRNSDYENLKDFEFEKRVDTIMNTSKYDYFVIKPTGNKAKSVDAKLPIHYIIENTESFKFPVVDPTGLLYRKWKKGTKIPNGLIKQGFTEKESHKEIFMELIQCIPTTKFILVDMDCR